MHYGNLYSRLCWLLLPFLSVMGRFLVISAHAWAVGPPGMIFSLCWFSALGWTVASPVPLWGISASASTVATSAVRSAVRRFSQ